jgi:hypothetical protein
MQVITVLTFIGVCILLIHTFMDFLKNNWLSILGVCAGLFVLWIIGVIAYAFWETRGWNKENSK